MTRAGRGRLAIAAAGLLAAGLVQLLFTLILGETRRLLDDRAWDFAVAATDLPGTEPASVLPGIVVVDIDGESLDRYGPWPWRRGLVADLVERVQAAGPAVVALDILFTGADQRSPAALARRLGVMTGDETLSALASKLDDDDARLARALAAGSSVLGFALGGVATPVPGPPLLSRGDVDLSALWRSSSAEGPVSVLVENAAGVGCLALPGESDGVVRRLPLLVDVDGDGRPGLALEAVRVALRAPLLRLDGSTGRLGVGERSVALAPDGMLRLAPPAIWRRIEVIPARDVLAGEAQAERLAGRIVFIGGSAPSLGGLRAAAGRPLVPTVMIQAQAARQILTGFAPRPPVAVVGAALEAGAALLGVAAPLLLGPLTAAAVVLLAGLGLVVATGAGLVEPVLPLLLGATAYLVAATLAYAGQTRRERAIRRRFAQHLSPAVVEMILRDPALLKLEGQRREVTALFTDIERFTDLTRRSDPAALVAVLDGYFDGMAAIVMGHGGMIDKFVGDAVHAFFNMPLDQPGHAEAAVRCGLELSAWSEAYRAVGAAAQLGLGPTRIGIETGVAIVGDVGSATKLDYTAHGDAVNAAARLEAANKELGTRFCVGPGTAAQCPPGLLRPGAALTLRGFDQPVQTFVPVA